MKPGEIGKIHIINLMFQTSLFLLDTKDLLKNSLSVHPSIYLFLVCFKATESEAGDMDLSGLPETAVDSEDDDDEEDIERASDPLMSRDIVRDCLEKDPIDRTDDDIGESG